MIYSFSLDFFLFFIFCFFCGISRQTLILISYDLFVLQHDG